MSLIWGSWKLLLGDGGFPDGGLGVADALSWSLDFRAGLLDKADSPGCALYLSIGGSEEEVNGLEPSVGTSGKSRVGCG